MSMAAAVDYTLDPEEFYRTNDMAMATFLKMNGNPVQHMSWVGQTCYWVFRITDALLDQIELFGEGNARVEPKEYNRAFHQTKKEFYLSKATNDRQRRS